MNPTLLLSLRNQDGTNHKLIPFPIELEKLNDSELALIRRLILKTFRDRFMKEPTKIHKDCLGQGCAECMVSKHIALVKQLEEEGYDIALYERS